MKLEIAIDLDGPAFELPDDVNGARDSEELAHVLRRLAERIEIGPALGAGAAGLVYGPAGEHVGGYTVTDDPTETISFADDASDLPTGTPFCPVCGADQVQEVDESERWNTIGEFTRDGDTLSIRWSLGDATFEHSRFQCGSCFATLTFPDDLHLDEDWS